MNITDQPVIIANLTEAEASDVYHFFHTKFSWAGHHFDTSDIESAWQYQQEEYNEGLVAGGEAPIRDITDEDIEHLTHTRDWLKYLSYRMCEDGGELVQEMVEEYINNLGAQQ